MTMDLRKTLTFFPGKAAERTREDVAAAVALVVAYWLDDDAMFAAVRRGDERDVTALERYVRERAVEALSTTRGSQIIMPLLGGYDLDAAFTRIESGLQGQFYARPERVALAREYELLRKRLYQVEALLR